MIASLAALVTAVATLIGVLVFAYVTIRRELRSTRGTVEQMHTVVNGRTTALLAYQATLIGLLNMAGVAVPAPPIDPAPDPGPATSQH